MTDLLSGLEAHCSKIGAPRDAELLFEDVRCSNYQHRPSRLSCHFLSPTDTVAQQRAVQWRWQDRRLVECYLVRSSGRYHYADVGYFEQCARGKRDEKLAHAYWSDNAERVPDDRLEILADSALYFPDWRSFPSVDADSLVRFDQANRRTRT